MEIRIYKGIILILFFFVSIYIARSLVLVASSFAPDFSVLWLAAKDLLTANNPYINPNLFTGVGYPPNTLLFYFPFTLFSYKLAQVLFLVTITLTILGSIYLSFKVSEKRIDSDLFLLVISLAFLSFPIKFNLGMGQNNSLALLFILLSYFFYKRSKHQIAGIFLGFSIALKTIFLIFLLFFVLRKEHKVIIYALGVIFLSVFLVFVVNRSGINLYEYYFEEVVPPLLNLSGREVYYNQGFFGFISRISNDLLVRRYSGILFTFSTILPPVYFSIKRERISLDNYVFSLFIVTLLLIDSLSWQHHFVWLIFTFVMITKWVLIKKSKMGAILLFLSYFLVSWNFKSPERYTGWPEVLLLSHTFYGAVILYFLNLRIILIQFRRRGGLGKSYL